MSETYELQFGDLDWSPAAQVDDVQVRVFGLRRGKAVPVVQVVESLIQDGGLERVERFENRDQQVILAIDASDSQALAEYESALFREVQKVRNELRYTPPDGFAPAGVFDVLWADLAFADDDALWDLDEVMRGRRNYVLTLRCLPFARSVDPFTVTGVTSTGTTTTTVNDASSTTGWSAVGSALGSGSGEVYVDVDVNNQTLADQPALVYSPASPIDMTGLPYLVVRWRIAGLAGAFDQAPTVAADGQTLTMVNTRYDGVTSRTVSTYICPDTSVASVRIRSPRVSGYIGGATTGTFNVDNLAKSDVAPSTGTLRQKATAVSVPGSARTPATLQVSHASSALGDVLVYTSPALAAGYVPALSPWAVSAGTTVATNISGKSWSLASGESFDFPASILPRGAYQIVARVKDQSFAPGFETITTTAATRLAGTNVDPSQIVVSKHASTSLSTSAYTNVVLGSFQLPPADVPAGSAAVVRVTIAGSVDLDDAWLLYLPDDGTSHVSLVPCGTAAPAAGGSSNRLFLNAATVDAPYPSCFVGTQADQSDARATSGASANWSEHLFPAGEGLVFVATSNAEDALVTVEGYARWHTHPAN